MKQGSLLGVARGRETPQQLAQDPEVQRDIARLMKENPPLPPVPAKGTANHLGAVARKTSPSRIERLRRDVKDLEEEIALLRRRHELEEEVRALNGGRRCDAPAMLAIVDPIIAGSTTLMEIRGRRRHAAAVEWRRKVVVALDAAGYSTVSIGAFIDRDHGTVSHLLGRTKQSKILRARQ